MRLTKWRSAVVKMRVVKMALKGDSGKETNQRRKQIVYRTFPTNMYIIDTGTYNIFGWRNPTLQEKCIHRAFVSLMDFHGSLGNL